MTLIAIARLMLERQRYAFSADAETAFRELISRRMTQPRFANARSVRNALERARLRQANRLVSGREGLVTRDDLMRIEAEDISRADGSPRPLRSMVPKSRRSRGLERVRR